MKNFSWKLAAVIVVVLAAIVYILPTVDMAINEKKEPTLWPKKKINLGLDLQGGMHLVLEVDTEKAVESTIERVAQELRSSLKKERIGNVALDIIEKTRISIKIKGEDHIKKFEKLFDEEFTNLRMLSKTTENDELSMMMDIPDQEADSIKKWAADQALETIRNRVDEFGVSEPDIRRQGEKRILIQLPGIEDTKRAKALIGKTALLEFKLLDEANDPVEAEKSQKTPLGSELLYQTKEDPETRRVIKTPYLVKKRSLLTGAYLTDAKVEIDQQYSESYVSITFDKKGARIFKRITGENVKKRLAIVLDDKLYSAPVIQEEIPGGEARITGNFTDEEARDLAIILRAGALPAPVNILEERTVGPSLGKDSINKGKSSVYIGGVLVLLFMIIYYRGAGMIADVALALNILLIAAGLAGFQATLTLPGIAGIILTIGMAVDANVLIFERIREELNIGKTPHAAVNAGYDRATLTILDANVTTLIAATVLFQFGTGPVKGFAVTLSMGVLSSLFTSLILTRLIFDYLLLHRKVKTLSI
ncbi:protein translocase subunit SecD [Desulfobacterales bacterium HSG2]|nr:protein translocase subunit SecD [Desulfobacterales bacterium HSG2]